MKRETQSMVEDMYVGMRGVGVKDALNVTRGERGQL